MFYRLRAKVVQVDVPVVPEDLGVEALYDPSVFDKFMSDHAGADFDDDGGCDLEAALAELITFDDAEAEHGAEAETPHVGEHVDAEYLVPAVPPVAFEPAAAPESVERAFDIWLAGALIRLVSL